MTKLPSVSETLPNPSQSDFANTTLPTLVRETCLTNPFWSDFRLLHFFEKQGSPITLLELHQLKEQLGLGDRKALCSAILHHYASGKILLNRNQLRFIERLYPAFRDRDIQSSHPGELLAYDCLLVRRLGHSKGKGMLYLHLFVDLFNGYVFGKFSQKRVFTMGFDMLKKHILPLYSLSQTSIQTVFYTAPPDELPKQTHDTTVTNIQWQHVDHTLGTTKTFYHYFMNEFFKPMEMIGLPLFLLQPSLDQWLRKYNYSHDFHHHRDMLQYIDP